jgi:hypothetical protein
MRQIGQGAVTETPLSGVLTRVGSQLYDVSTRLHEYGVGKGAAMWTDHAYGPLYRTARGRHVGFDRVNQHLPCLLTRVKTQVAPGTGCPGAAKGVQWCGTRKTT